MHVETKCTTTASVGNVSPRLDVDGKCGVHESSCFNCNLNEFSTEGSRFCSTCSVGKIAFTRNGVTECDSCLAGYYQPAVGQTGLVTKQLTNQVFGNIWMEQDDANEWCGAWYGTYFM